MADNPASVNDLVNRSLRTLSSTELQVGSTLLGDAWAQVQTSVPSLASRLDDAAPGSALEGLTVQVVCAMVLRVLNNPEGVLEESGDDYNRRLDQAVSSGALYVSDAEAELLSRTAESSGAGFTIKPAAQSAQKGYWATPDNWVIS